MNLNIELIGGSSTRAGEEVAFMLMLKASVQRPCGADITKKLNTFIANRNHSPDAAVNEGCFLDVSMCGRVFAPITLFRSL